MLKKIRHRANHPQVLTGQTALISTGKNVEKTQSGSGFTDEENRLLSSGNQSPVKQLANSDFTVKALNAFALDF